MAEGGGEKTEHEGLPITHRLRFADQHANVLRREQPNA